MLDDVRLIADASALNDFKKSFHKELNGVGGIDHITLHLIHNSSTSHCLTTSRNQVQHYLENQHYLSDYSLISNYANTLPFYSWDVCASSQAAKNLNHIKKNIYGLHSGTNFIRELTDKFKLIYSVATYSQDPMKQYTLLSNINLILEAGDFLYNTFCHFYEDCTKDNLPKLSFEPFRGGSRELTA